MESGLDVVVRPEQSEDTADVRELNEQAFGGPLEARIVDRLWGMPGAIPLVATAGGRVVGHILFTPVRIEPTRGDPRVAGLAPMAVRPEVQYLGIGGELVRAGLDECRRAGYVAVVVLGHPGYYPRFGFRPASTFGLSYEHRVPAEAFMALELERGSLAGESGIVRYLPEFAE